MRPCGDRPSKSGLPPRHGKKARLHAISEALAAPQPVQARRKSERAQLDVALSPEYICEVSAELRLASLAANPTLAELPDVVFYGHGLAAQWRSMGETHARQIDAPAPGDVRALHERAGTCFWNSVTCRQTTQPDVLWLAAKHLYAAACFGRAEPALLRLLPRAAANFKVPLYWARCRAELGDEVGALAFLASLFDTYAHVGAFYAHYTEIVDQVLDCLLRRRAGIATILHEEPWVAYAIMRQALAYALDGNAVQAKKAKQRALLLSQSWPTHVVRVATTWHLRLAVVQRQLDMCLHDDGRKRPVASGKEEKRDEAAANSALTGLAHETSIAGVPHLSITMRHQIGGPAPTEILSMQKLKNLRANAVKRMQTAHDDAAFAAATTEACRLSVYIATQLTQTAKPECGPKKNIELLHRAVDMVAHTFPSAHVCAMFALVQQAMREATEPAYRHTADWKNELQYLRQNFLVTLAVRPESVEAVIGLARVETTPRSSPSASVAREYSRYADWIRL